MKFKNIKTNNIIIAEQSFIDTLLDKIDWKIIPDTIPSLDEQKQAKIKQLHDKYQKMYDVYLAQYPKREVDSFAVKQAEAIAYNLDNTAPTPVIDALIKTSGDTKANYVASVLAKVTALAEQEGQMVKIRDSIKACTTQKDLDAIVI